MVFAVGLMSGTSMDGVDAALIRVISTDPFRIELLSYLEYPIEGALKDKLKSAMKLGTTQLICQLNFEVGEVFAAAALKVIEQGGMKPENVSFIGSHGQTIYHIPQVDASREWETPSTLQIGDPCVIAERTSILTVGDFRVRDMAAGGTGAPLIPYMEALLIDPELAKKGVVFHNIGGIANCTFINESGIVTAFDTGPGNMIMDILIQRQNNGLSCDADGAMGRAGVILPKLLNKTLSMPYFSANLPKCTGHELFGAHFVDSFVEEGLVEAREMMGDQGEVSEKTCIPHLIATAAEVTALSIANAYDLYLGKKPPLVAVSGGGAKNPFLMQRIQHNLGDHVRIQNSSEVINVPSDAKEAVGFALLAYATLMGNTSNIPQVTGARNAVILGKIALGAGSSKIKISI